MRSAISGTSLALSASTDFFGRPVNSTLGVKDGANDLGSVAVDYTYQGGTGSQTTEFVSSYKNVVTPTTGSATNVEYTYTYDANGNIVSDSLGGTLKHSYVYDEAGQLVRVNDAVQNKTFCYTYDNGGNLIYKKRYAYTTGTLGSVLQTMATYVYGDNNWKDKLTSYNTAPLSYDAIGNLTSFDGISYTWSAGRQLEKYEISAHDYSIEYKYNADGLRTQKKIVDDEYYYYATYDYIWADGKLVSQTDGTDALYFLYDSNDSPIGFVLNDAATYLYIKNLQSDITGIADENGAIIVNYSYDEWGKLLSTTGSEADTIGLLNPLRYRGYYYDTETGYYYLQNRYYNSSWGRFINADELPDSTTSVLTYNLYSYCENNSIVRFDPSGNRYDDMTPGQWSEYQAQQRKVSSAKQNWEKSRTPSSARDYIYLYLINRFNVTPLQACAILGNISVETGNTFNPLILQNSTKENRTYVKNYNSYDGIGWGILQWSFYTRKMALFEYAQSINKTNPPVGDLTVQLEYFNKERSSLLKSDWDKFKSKKTLNSMVQSFCEDYERAGLPHLDKRKSAAEECRKIYIK